MDKLEKMKLCGELHKKNKSKEEIAEILGMCVSSVNNYLSALGLRERRAETAARKVLKLHYEGYNSRQIAYELQVSRNFVLETLRNNGIRRPCLKYDLINDKTVYAKKKKIELEREIINGKRYVVINPLLFPES